MSAFNENENTNAEFREPARTENNEECERAVGHASHVNEIGEPVMMYDDGARYEIGEGNPLRINNTNYPGNEIDNCSKNNMKVMQHNHTADNVVEDDGNDNIDANIGNTKNDDNSSVSSLASSTGKVVKTM